MKLLLALLCLSLPSLSMAQENVVPEVETEVPTPPKKFIDVDSQLSLEFRSDRLREEQNQNTTNIRNFSLQVSLFDNEKSNMVVELLGEENLSGDLNVNVGKLYYEGRTNLYGGSHLDSSLRVGVMKLGYGILNEIDGLFAVLPAYYSYLYDLPRGLDTGLSVSTQFFHPSLTLTGAVFAGKNLRQTDNKNRELDVVPHHFQLGWKPTEQTNLAAHYYARKYEGQPLIRGIGFEGHQQVFRWGGWGLRLDAEAWSILSSMNGIENEGLTALLAPRLFYKRVFFQPYLAMERWSQAGTEDNTETYFTGKLGYEFNKHIQFVLEQTQIRNVDTKLLRENSYQARVVSQWQF